MLSSDIHALRDLLLSICGNSNLDTLTQRDAQTVLHGIRDEAWRILADAAYVWNGGHAMVRLLHELLAECFSFLPFHCRFSASQVCRDWRAAAINTPALWENITGLAPGVRLTVELVQCAFSRAGNVPLHFEYRYEINPGMSPLVCSAMHRMASLSIGKWNRGYAILVQSAPLLGSLRLLHGAYLPENFLAGAPGKLAVLDARNLRLAPSCPGFSNLSILRLANCKAQTLREMFRLCPRLRSLSVGSIAWTSRENIGHPPESLEELSLESTRNRYNTTEVYEAFKDYRNLKQISLTQFVSDTGSKVGPVLHGVVELDVAWPRDEDDIGTDDISLTARFEDDRRIVLSLYRMPREWAFTRIFAYRAGFAQLRALRLPLQALPAFADCADPPPDVEACVEIPDGLDFTAPRAYSWDYLRPLAVIAPRNAVLVVAPHSAGDGPDEHDARALVAELARVSSTVDIFVRGFSRDAVPEDLVEAPNIVFEYDAALV